MKHPYRILLAEDHIMFREGVKKTLTEVSGLEVAGEVSDGLELLAAVEALAPDMIILDIGLPQVSGLEAAQQIKETHPEIKILMLTMYKTSDHLTRAFEAKVDGYLLKENAYQDLLAAIETIREGRLYISSFVSQEMLEGFRRKSAPTRTKVLSRRQKEVLKCLAEGKTYQEIAELLLISPNTVRTHLVHIKKKLSIKSSVELARYALKKGYTTLT